MLLLNYVPAAVAHGAQIGPLHEVQRLSRTDDGDYRVHYTVVHDVDYRQQAGSGTINARIFVLAAGAGATPVILQRSAETLGAKPAAAGRHFSGNGERLDTAILDEERARDLLGLDRGDGTAFEAAQVPGALTVNPAMTVAALAEQAVPGIVRAARERGVAVEYVAPAPDGSTGGRRGVLSLATTLQHG